jgi:hypothetical protein
MRVAIHVDGNRYQMSCGHKLTHYFNNVDEMPPTMAFHLMAVASNGIAPMIEPTTTDSAYNLVSTDFEMMANVDHRVSVNPWRLIGWKVTPTIYYLIVPETEIDSILCSYIRKPP